MDQWGINKVKMPALSTMQKLILWATFSLAGLSVLYPKPTTYEWRGDRWERTRSVTIFTPVDRRFFLDYDNYGAARSDKQRAGIEAVVILVIGIALAFAAKHKSTEPSVPRIIGILTIVTSLCLISLATLTIKAGNVEQELLLLSHRIIALDNDLSSVEQTVSNIERDVSSIEGGYSTIKIETR